MWNDFKIILICMASGLFGMAVYDYTSEKGMINDRRNYVEDVKECNKMMNTYKKMMYNCEDSLYECNKQAERK